MRTRGAVARAVRTLITNDEYMRLIAPFLDVESFCRFSQVCRGSDDLCACAAMWPQLYTARWGSTPELKALRSKDDYRRRRLAENSPAERRIKYAEDLLYFFVQ